MAAIKSGVAAAVMLAVILSAGNAAAGDPVAGAQSRKPAAEAELRYWLENMVWGFGFEHDEIRAATGLTEQEIQGRLAKLAIAPTNKPARAKDAPLHMLPWPGGRRISGTRNARVEAARQRDTKVGVLAPWEDGGYVVLDMPEVLYVAREGDSGRQILYVAHYLGDSVWEKDEHLKLEPIEWSRPAANILETGRVFPGGKRYSSQFASKFVAFRNSVRMKITLTNESGGLFRGPQQAQNCVFMMNLKGGFGGPDSRDVISQGYHARSSADGKKWLIIAWVPLMTPPAFGFCPAACWGNPEMPCCHSDPQFGDIPPGESRSVYGWFSFYEGEDIRDEIARIEKTGWKDDRWDDMPRWNEAGAEYQ